MATLTKFYVFVEDLAEKVHNLGSDTLRFMLANTAPSLSNTQRTDITEIAAGNGYVANGQSVTVTSSAQSSGLYTLIASDVSWTATPSAMAAFRYAVLYNDTSTNDKLIGYIDFGYSITLSAGQTFTIDLDQTSGLLYMS
jgi:hypothetical protein